MAKDIFELDVLNESEQSVAVPGGLTETPENKGDNTSIPVPANTEIKADVYNNALVALKKSFKESCEVIDMLLGLRDTEADDAIVEATTGDELVEGEAEYLESLDDTIMESFDNGIYYEAVKREDKAPIKKIVASLRPKLIKMMKETKVKFYKPALVARMLTFQLIPGMRQIWKTRLWQVLGIIVIESGHIEETANKLTDLFKDELGDYRIIHAPVPPAFLDFFRLKFGLKNTKKTYFLLVDKTLDKELKGAIKELENEIKNNKNTIMANTTNADASKNDVKTESADNDIVDRDDEFNTIQESLQSLIDAGLLAMSEAYDIGDEVLMETGGGFRKKYLEQLAKKQDDMRSNLEKLKAKVNVCKDYDRKKALRDEYDSMMIKYKDLFKQAAKYDSTIDWASTDSKSDDMLIVYSISECLKNRKKYSNTGDTIGREILRTDKKEFQQKFDLKPYQDPSDKLNIK